MTNSFVQAFSFGQVLILAYQSVGVIYGDIGTSPLYVFSSTFEHAPIHIDLLGALSLVLWTLTLMVTVKYILIILHADNDGEGGTFSTYSLLSRYVSAPANSRTNHHADPKQANIANRDPREATLVRECYLSMTWQSVGANLLQVWKELCLRIWHARQRRSGKLLKTQSSFALFSRPSEFSPSPWSCLMVS